MSGNSGLYAVIAHHRDADICFGIHAAGVGMIENISRSREEVERLVKRFNACALSPIHFFDVMSDYLLDQSNS